MRDAYLEGLMLIWRAEDDGYEGKTVKKKCIDFRRSTGSPRQSGVMDHGIERAALASQASMYHDEG